MGIAVRELLALDYFKDFHVVAGHKGLSKEIQGIATLEAPDATRWSKGKELVLSSGYVLHQEPDCIRIAFEEGHMPVTSAFMLKRDRYLDHIPEEMIQLFEEHDIPLITMPFSIPWMELMSEINIAVMNQTIRRFRISGSQGLNKIPNVSYKEQKIKKILQAVEAEMEFPAFLFDFLEETGYYSSVHFRRIADSFGLSDEDFWDPSMPHTRHTLCDYIHMSRYRLVEQEAGDRPRVSWIRIPITINGTLQAFFVVMESRELLDYYDEYSIRIAFLMLQSLYEQITITKNVGNIGFENFILYVLNSDKECKDLMFQANLQGLSLNTQYTYVLFQHEAPAGRIAGDRLSTEEYYSEPSPDTQSANKGVQSRRKEIIHAFQESSLPKAARIAIIGENEGMLFINAEENAASVLERFQRLMLEKCPELKLQFGISSEKKNFYGLKESVNKCWKALQMGQLLFPQKNIWYYEDMGPLAWLQIPEPELEGMLSQYRDLMADERNVELLRTLKIYLENNMNYSITAEKMFVHINTIRKRIEKLNDVLTLDWDSPIAKLNATILLQFLDL
ncbi:PucR family transcriptional regulator [Hespellia stercorisuis]|uniref:PucR C-terminal helix-turn-helix domain-containing protein n=1 Tax=Hespellia stercorisuis DSM 15480 TaxID=1121950 RepID=A0A1M6VY14_9FIRM|nr:PucR family transcriptional regulator [Hespellia stercorisuis]SHK86334.1 PucR C-terminal helix-turn-helix domain-containing protein [Hespellia stercorisuis DSM 15480]